MIIHKELDVGDYVDRFELNKQLQITAVNYDTAGYRGIPIEFIDENDISNSILLATEYSVIDLNRVVGHYNIFTQDINLYDWSETTHTTCAEYVKCLIIEGAKCKLIPFIVGKNRDNFKVLKLLLYFPHSKSVKGMVHNF